MGSGTSSGSAGNINAAIGGVSDRDTRDSMQGGSWYTKSSSSSGGSYGKTTYGELHNPEIGGSRDRTQEQNRVNDITAPGGYMEAAHNSMVEAEKKIEDAAGGIGDRLQGVFNLRDQIFLNKEGLYDVRTVYDFNPLAAFATLFGGPVAGFMAKHVSEDILGAQPITLNVSKIGEDYDGGRDFTTSAPEVRSKTTPSGSSVNIAAGNPQYKGGVATGNSNADFTEFFNMIKTAFPTIDFSTLPVLDTLALPTIDLTTTLDTVNTLRNTGVQAQNNPIPLEHSVRTPVFGSK